MPQENLLTLQLAEQPWSSISVGFITYLPISEGYDLLMVVVDRFSKMIECLSCNKTISTKETAIVFL